ncbi:MULTISPECIES: type II toxin-antitoxin system VapC family toxin [unclassified Sphingomonas]|uniref:type II toxin-antitoxin system VapC family toxin n=1 Tax=unclassified Sphingomonas TaxID=196159 RepID=UPI0028585047|nr:MULTISPECIES: type II toxin-antitoxin system VapC family toxin [unclassified Sphingomonas]MDR6116640.1 putative nucleic-acid-binding protein [Sphingomonas sp. SORGH_AS_0789]MDR6149683.1 putative nucleic-acid-binding protein [Sphingomonas sp. SORGH_AS_0742]
MRITADTNILVRAVTEDDPIQSPIAQKLLAEATVVAMPVTALCEFCWVLDRLYRVDRADIARAIRTLTNAANAVVDMPAVDAGLAILEQGGDFADGVVAYQGKWLGADTFVSFDRKAINLLERGGQAVLLPS